ncbi:MAG TPA: hybrid sensor histidine kinase/response regulator [Steroidobacteraceae bacterium]|jgi:signal transduction histidine kinase/CheY-like chemotaxis protein|nr:hybrid sensor histidine kinase/response regulator [Steroidobacteraceae bacterium]
MKTNDAELTNRIGAEQVRSAYSNTAPGMSSTAVGALLIAGILGGSGAVSWTVAIVFAGCMLLQIGARLTLIFTYLRRKPRDSEWRLWNRRFSIGALVASLFLGGSSWWLLPPQRFDMQLLLMLYLCAVASGAVTAFGVLRPAIFFSILPMMLLPTAWMLAQGDWMHWVMALIILAWLFAVTDQARRYGAQFEESVRLRFENEDLIARLRGEKLIAEEASTAKSRFLAAASHDLRQPVHALTLFVAALRPRVNDAEARRLLDHIDSSVQAMGGLFNGLLDISRLDAGVVEVHPQTFAMQPLLERICRDFIGDAEAKKIELKCKRTRAAVYSDPLLVERVVRNIVANAIAYTDTGRVLVGCRRRGRTLSVQVWDTGRGIPESEHTRIFTEFYQVANPERDRSKGVGLGLAIVKRLTALLGHPLSLHSQPNRGSVFTLDLPLSDAAISAAGPASEEGGELVAGGLILVVDDEATIQMAMKSLLEGWGFQAIVAGSFDEILPLLANCPDHPALMICDYRLRAHEDGIRVIERLRAEYNDDEIPGMLITGDTAPDRLREAQESGLLLLHKPVANSRLRASITHLVAHPGRRAETSPPASG